MAAVLAAVVGLGNAAVSAYWALGGTALLDTVGGSIERWARQRGPSVVAALWAIVALKDLVALAAPALAGRPRSLPRWTSGQLPRTLGSIASVTLIAYGGSLTIVGFMVQGGVLEAALHANRKPWPGAPTSGTRGS